MSVFGFATLALWFLAMGGASLRGQETPKLEGRKIVATSTVTISVPPDAARLSGTARCPSQSFRGRLGRRQAIAGDAKLTVAEVQVTPEDSPLLRLALRSENVPQNALISIKVQVRVTCSY